MPADATPPQASPAPDPKAPADNEFASLKDEYDIDSNVDDAVDVPAAPAKTTPAPKTNSSPAVTVNGVRPDPAKPAAPKHPAYLTKRAEELGLADEDIAGLTTDQLDREVYTLTKQHIEHQKEMARFEALTNANARRPEPAAVAETPTEESLDWGEETDALSGKKVKVAEDAIHPGIVNQFKAMQKQIKDLQAQLGGINQREQHRENMTRAQQVDAAFNDMSVELFGKGTVHDMDPTDLALMRRKMVVDSLKAKPPTKAGSITKHIQDRARELFGLEAQQVEEEVEVEKPRPKPRQQAAAERPRNPDGTFADASLEDRKALWNRGGVAKPTQRDSPGEKKGTRKAEKAAAEYLQEYGMLEPDEEVLNGFLS